MAHLRMYDDLSKIKPLEIVESPALKSQRCMIELRRLIQEGELSPGQRIYELWVADRLKASRTPVRAALAQLEHEGLLKLEPGAGLVVASYSQNEVLDSFELRGKIEGLAARLAAQRGSDESITALAPILSALETVLSDSANLRRDDFAMMSYFSEKFHQTLVAAAQSLVLQRQFESLCALPFSLDNAASLAVMQRPALLEAQAQRQAIYAALKARAIESAENLTTEQVRAAAGRFMALLSDPKTRATLPSAALIVS